MCIRDRCNVWKHDDQGDSRKVPSRWLRGGGFCRWRGGCGRLGPHAGRGSEGGPGRDEGALVETRAAFLRKIAEHIQGGGRVGPEAIARIRDMGYIRLAQYVDEMPRNISQPGVDLMAQFFRTTAAVEDIAEATAGDRAAV